MAKVQEALLLEVASQETVLQEAMLVEAVLQEASYTVHVHFIVPQEAVLQKVSGCVFFLVLYVVRQTTLLVVNCSVNTTCSQGSSVTGRHRYHPMVHACAVGSTNLHTDTILYQYCGTAISLYS